MPAEKDTLFGNLAVERRYVSQEQLDEALAAQKAAAEASGLTISLSQVLVGKKLLTPDQAQDLEHTVAVQTGEARLVAGYEVLVKIGQGGMGAVYKARKIDSGEVVALKILLPSLATPDYVKRFERESKMVQKLNHENIVSCVDFGLDPRRKLHFCALEFVEGEDLGDRVKRLGVLPEDEAISVTRQVAQALQHAYLNGLVHRDIKPENIMVTPGGAVKLLDLGLARPVSQEATRLTQSGMFVGSVFYASPEQAKAEKEIDIRSDVYSLGATLYYMITGRPPFEGETALMVLQQHVYEQLQWPAEINPDISEGLCLVITKMMAKDPADRYQTPDDLVRALDGLAQGVKPEIGERVMKTSTIARAGAAVKRGHRPPPRGGRPARRDGRDSRRQTRFADRAAEKPAKPVGLMAGVGVVAAVVVIALVFAFGGKEEEKPAKLPKAKPPPRVPVARREEEKSVRVHAPRRAAIDALREAEEHEKAHPDDLAGVIAKYEAVSRDFPGTVESGKAQINIERVKARIAAATALPQRTPSTQRTAETRGTAGTSTTTEKPEPPSPVVPSVSSETSVPSVAKAVDVAALLARFDSLMSKGDYAGARRYAEAEAATAAAAGGVSVTDDFSGYADGSDGSPRWKAPAGWQVRGGSFSTDGYGAAVMNVPEATSVTVEATVIPRARTRGEGWTMVGLSLHRDDSNYWYLGLYQKPDGPRYMDFSEKLNGVWRAQYNTPKLTCTQWDDLGWDYNKPYTFRIEMTPAGIAGSIVAAGGNQPAKIGFKFDNTAVTSGRPALRVEGTRAEFDDVKASATDVAAKAANAARAKLLRAVARVAGSLAGRQEAIRLAVEALSGNEAAFETVSGGRRGKLKGKVAEATVDGFALLMELKQGRRVVGETRMAVKWSDLAHEEEDRLARKGGWEAKGADAAMARAVLAKARGQMKAASAALAEAGDHPLAETYRMRLGDAETQAAYDGAMKRARGRMRSKNWKRAVESLEEALAAKPEDAEAKKLLAEAESHIAPAPTLTLDLGNKVTMEFVYIKPGRFVMGSNEENREGWQAVEKPKHEVTITKGFYLGRYEVTRGQFAAFVNATGYRTEAEKEGKSWGRRTDGSWGDIAGGSWRDPVVFAQDDTHPVMSVSWNDVKAFCEWATGKTRREVRLPTEAEWEYACRAGTTTRYCFGDQDGGLGEYAWFRQNSGWATHPVGQKKPNAWGLYDMHGNVWEWVADWASDTYYASSPAADPTGPANGSSRVLRGGSWYFNGFYCRSAYRLRFDPTYRINYIGFRVVVPPSPGR